VGGSIVGLTSLDNAKSSPARGRTVALHRSQPHDGHGAMSAVEDPGTKLTPAEWRDLRRLAAFMVPASAEYGVPGADDEAIFADIVRSLGRDRDASRKEFLSPRAREEQITPRCAKRRSPLRSNSRKRHAICSRRGGPSCTMDCGSSKIDAD
jgi:hypothetical protein